MEVSSHRETGCAQSFIPPPADGEQVSIRHESWYLRQGHIGSTAFNTDNGKVARSAGSATWTLALVLYVRAQKEQKQPQKKHNRSVDALLLSAISIGVSDVLG